MVPRLLKQNACTDFTGWKDHDTYQKQFARLLCDLQAVDAQEVSAVEAVLSVQPKRKPTEFYRVTLR